MSDKPGKKFSRARRHRRIRKKIRGVPGRERLCVFRSTRHIYAQVIDDENNSVLCAASTLSAETREGLKNGGNVEAARAVGKVLARKCKDRGIEKVVFDRGGYAYHGRVRALSEGAREGGLVF